VLNYSNFVLSS